MTAFWAGVSFMTTPIEVVRHHLANRLEALVPVGKLDPPPPPERRAARSPRPSEAAPARRHRTGIFRKARGRQRIPSRRLRGDLHPALRDPRPKAAGHP